MKHLNDDLVDEALDLPTSSIPYWIGVLTGMCAASILFMCVTFMILEQNNKIRSELSSNHNEISSLSEKVQAHDEIMSAYAFYNWQFTLPMREPVNEDSK